MFVLAVQVLIPVRRAEDQHEEIGDGQVRQEEVRGVAHVSIPQDDDDHERIADHAHQQDERVEQARREL